MISLSIYTSTGVIYLHSKLSRTFYARDAKTVAQELLGKTLITRLPQGDTGGLIVECEAYLGREDKAAHSFRGKKTQRTQVLFGPPGHAYVYLIYGMYHCFNIVVGQKDDPQAVLIRALEPTLGLELMIQRRNTDKGKLLTSGPGRLSDAMGITRELNGEDLLGDKIFIAPGPAIEPRKIVALPRVGIDYAEEWADKPLRYYLKDNAFISKP
jgi:DNA-3-methyladenine glycosylase